MSTYLTPMGRGFQQQRPSNIQIIKVILTESSTFQQQYRRPFVTNINTHSIQSVHERIQQVGGNPGSISPGLMAGVAHDIMAPQIAPESPILIPNGWGTKRFNFFIEVRIIRDGIVGYTTEFLQGYTDKIDDTYSGTLDPRMMMIVNSVTQTKMINQYANGVIGQIPVITNAHQLLYNSEFTGIESLINNTTASQRSLRPWDVEVEASRMISEDILDLRTSNIGLPRPSRRSNTLPSNYTSNILNSYATAMSDRSMGESNQSVWSNASVISQEQGISNDAFFSILSKMKNEQLTNIFSWRDLIMLDPALNHDNRVIQVRQGPMSRHIPEMAFNAGNTQHWEGQDGITHAATIISNSIISLMVLCGFMKVDIRMTNHVYGGTHDVVFSDANGLGGVDTRPFMEQFKGMFISEVIHPITFGGQIPYNIRIRCELAGGTLIEIQLDQSPMEIFHSPSFADALITPVITTDPRRLTDIGNDFNNLVSGALERPQMTAQSIQQYGQHF